MKNIEYDMAIVVNECYGGFRLSDAAAQELAKRKGKTLIPLDRFFLVEKESGRLIEETVPRNDPDLIAIVQSFGSAASGAGAKLVVRNITIVVEIVDYHDGHERVEVHSIRGRNPT